MSNEVSFSGELRGVAKLAFPIALAHLGMVSMGLVDVAIVGRTTVNDLAAVSMGRSIVFAASAVAMGVSSAVEPLSAQALGAGEKDRAWAALVATVRACALVSAPILVAIFGVTLLLGPLGIGADVVERVRLFALGNVPGVFAFVVFLAGKSFLQTHGSTWPALLAVVVANVVNAVACSLLVRGDAALASLGLPAIGFEGWGAFGAGLATSIGSTVLAAIVFGSVRKYRPPTATEQLPVRTVLKLGLPIGLQILAEIGVFSMVALLAGRLGPDVVSAHQVALGLASLTFMGALGVSGAAATRVGHAIGAGRSPRRAGLVSFGMGAFVALLGATAFTLFPHFLVSLFTDDASVLRIGVSLLGVAALFQLFDCLQAVGAGALRGAGDVRFPFVANVVAHWALGFPVALLLGFVAGWGARGLWWGLTLGLVSIALLLTWRFASLTRSVVARIDEPR